MILNDTRKTLPATTDEATTLELIGTAAVVAATLTVAVIIIAPRLASTAVGGAFAALGARLLKSSFEGQ